MKRITKIILISFILAGLMAVSSGCGTESDEAELSETQIVTVQRSDLTIDITAAGNLALSHTEDLAFDLFYQEGTVEEVLVEEGDIVIAGQVLARLDTEEWEDQLSTLEEDLVAAQRNLTAKERKVVTAERKVIELERAVTTKENTVTKAERQITARELATSQAQLDLQRAEDNLSEIDEVRKVQDNIDDAEYALKFAESMLAGEFGDWVHLSVADYSYWSQVAANAEEELDEAQEELQELLNGLNISVSIDVALEIVEKQLQVKQKLLALEDAQIAVDDAGQAVEDAKYALGDAQLNVVNAGHDVEDAELDVEDARKALLDVQEKLDDASGKGPVITAPFAGFVTMVNVEGGDEVMTGTIAVQLADPENFEADILVSEMDILQAKLGGEAWVTVDAMQGLNLPAHVTHIAPTATIQSGVVNYVVKVEVESLEAVMQERQEMRQNIISGALPDRLKQAIEDGQITQEQAEEMMKQGQQVQETPQTQMPAMVPEGFQLREGLTVIVSILVEERTDVLLVPNSAIARKGNETYVSVMSPDGSTTERLIQTGISDWQYTEVIDGLSEGEEVIVPKGTAPSATSQPGSGRSSMPFLPPH